MNKHKNKSIKRKKDIIIFDKKISKDIERPQPAVFFDRDGVIIEDCHYINKKEKVKLCPGAKDLLRYFFKREIIIVIITNQSGITKKYLSWSDYSEVTNQLISLLEEPNPVTAIYANSYVTEKPSSNWRKPNPSMILSAANHLNLDLKRSILIGDRISDIYAGINAKIPNIFHVKTGHGEKERSLIKNQIEKEPLLKNRKKLSKLYFLDTLLDFPLDLIPK